MRHGAITECSAAGQIGHHFHVRRSHHTFVVGCDVDEQLVGLHVLLRMGPDQVVVREAGDGEHRLAIQLGVVQPVEQMDRAWPGGGQADAELARVLRIRARHEGGRFFVANVDEPNPVLVDPKRLHDAVDAVAG